jgi:small subunit ribosomal protein S16
MAVKLRLARFGKTGSPQYRLVAIDEHKKRNGRAIEILGTYNPHDLENRLNYKKDRVNYWLSVGATPSDTVRQLLQK